MTPVHSSNVFLYFFKCKAGGMAGDGQGWTGGEADRHYARDLKRRALALRDF